MNGAASAALEGDARLDAATKRELLESIRDEAERLNRLVNNLIEFARPRPRAFMRTDLRDVVAGPGIALQIAKRPHQGHGVAPRDVGVLRGPACVDERDGLARVDLEDRGREAGVDHLDGVTFTVRHALVTAATRGRGGHGHDQDR